VDSLASKTGNPQLIYFRARKGELYVQVHQELLANYYLIAAVYDHLGLVARSPLVSPPVLHVFNAFLEGLEVGMGGDYDCLLLLLGHVRNLNDELSCFIANLDDLPSGKQTDLPNYSLRCHKL
jgi:hypothetical protein